MRYTKSSAKGISVIDNIRASCRRARLSILFAIGLVISICTCGHEDNADDLGDADFDHVANENAGGAAQESKEITAVQDSGVDEPWPNWETPGCTAKDEDLETIPENLDGFVSPIAFASEVAGTWTNSDEDTLTVQTLGSARLHIVEGTPLRSSTGGDNVRDCESESYIALDTKITLSTRDGRFDERLDTEIRVFGSIAIFKVNIALESVQGNFLPTGVEDGVLSFNGEYGISGIGWNLSGEIKSPSQSSNGTTSGWGQTVYFAPFESNSK